MKTITITFVNDNSVTYEGVAGVSTNEETYFVMRWPNCQREVRVRHNYIESIDIVEIVDEEL